MVFFDKSAIILQFFQLNISEFICENFFLSKHHRYVCWICGWAWNVGVRKTCCTAGTCEGVFPGQLADDPNHRGQAEPRHVAGHLVMRAPGPRRLSQAAHHAQRLPAGLQPLPHVTRLPDGQHEQLGQSLGALHR